MALRRKGSAPWSLTKDAGLSDAPISGHPFVEGDEVKPVIDAGFIDEKGLWQLNRNSDDSAFKFQDPAQALAAGASIFIDPINMLNHDLLILGMLDASGNEVNVDLVYETGAAITEGPYASPIFTDTGVNAYTWQSNDPGDLTGSMIAILNDTSEGLKSTWRFYKIGHLRGTVGMLRIRSNEGADAGTISTAYLRLV